MHDRPIGQMVRCSKVRAMFASRACRKSVMIGDSLNRQQMVKVSEHINSGSALRHGLRDLYRFFNTWVQLNNRGIAPTDARPCDTSVTYLKSRKDPWTLSTGMVTVEGC